MSKPEAEVEISPALVGELVRTQHPDLARGPITGPIAGWDNAVFRLGEELGVRLPRRAAALDALQSEQRWLPSLQCRLPLPVPAPLRVGRPQSPYPWPWSITPWIAGLTADRSPPDRDQAGVFAAFLDALHTEPPPEAPRNPYRGVPLAQRHAAFLRGTNALARRGRPLDARLLRLWLDALERPLDVAATWIHGDLHPSNVLVANGRISGVIDWGDLAQGDRATDLAATWMLFAEGDSREAIMARYKSVSSDTWARARAWALLLSVVVLEAEDPSLSDAAESTMQRLIEGP